MYKASEGDDFMPANLSIEKTAFPTIANVGEEINYTITVRNNGPDPATDVVLTDAVPAHACLTSISTSPQLGCFSYANSVIRWPIGQLDNQATVTLTASVIPQIAPDTLTNVATVTWYADGLPFPNSSSDDATVVVSGTSVPEADLAITKVSCPPSIIAGDSLTYQLRVTNNGPSTATDVLVTDTLPPGITPVSAVSDTGVCTINGQNVTCLIGTMAANERVSIAIEALTSTPGTFMNSCNVTGSVPDPNITNNTDSAYTEVHPGSFLSISKTASPDPVIVGELLTYEITVHNSNSSEATGVKVTEVLPLSVDVISISCNQGSDCCTPIGLNQYLCQLGTIPANGTAGITIKVRPQEPGCITNSATLESTSINLNPCTTKSTTTSVLRPVADVAITKNHCPEKVAICTPITYTITVTNNGPSPATGVIVTDQLPSCVEVLRVCTNQGHCLRQCNKEITCQLGTLAIGATAIIDITVKPCLTGTITNTAFVTANENDIFPENNQAIDSVTVLSPKELLEDLIHQINNLTELGVITQQVADYLLLQLNKAQNAITCCNITYAIVYLNYFIEAVHSYSEESILPPEAACLLINLAEMIKESLCCGKEKGDD